MPPTGLSWKLALAAAGVLLASAAAWKFWPRPESLTPIPLLDSVKSEPPSDPRLTFPTPFRNVKPDVAYLGDAACAACHGPMCDSYHEHPMGRSAALPVRARPVERYDPAARDPFTGAGGLEYRVEKRGDRVLHRVTGKGKGGTDVAVMTLEADVAIGSGRQGRSYLGVRGDSVWMSPVSWYSGRACWDLSPGAVGATRFQRPVGAECLSCHTDRVAPVPDTVNRYEAPVFRGQLNVGCERCHGPGALHVAERQVAAKVEGIDTSIVNPRHLPAVLRDSVCQQCHLQGEGRVERRGRSLLEYRPGLPLEMFVSVYIAAPRLLDERKSVGQVEQLAVGKCFPAIRAKQGCATCHDPHVDPEPAAKADYYRTRCNACHEQQPCAAPKLALWVRADDCVACHMPRADSSNIAHTSVTNHRIPRFPKGGSSRPVAGDGAPFVPFFTGEHVAAAERERDLGVFLATWAGDQPLSDARSRSAAWGAAEEKLRAALARRPDDLVAREALARTFAGLGRKREARQAVEDVLASSPRRESALATARDLAWGLEDYPAALDFAARTIAVNPAATEHRADRARLRTLLGRWADAALDWKEAVRLEPVRGDWRLLYAACLHRTGDAEGAGRELAAARVLARDPAQEDEFLRLYRELTTGRRRRGPRSPRRSGS
jgi:hypothetical protein